jgi:WD40 repeat protein
MQLALEDGNGEPSSVAFSPDGETLVTANADTTLRIWNARTGQLQRTVDEMALVTFALAFSPDGQVLATSGADRTIHFWDTKTWKSARTISGQAEMISHLAFSPDGQTLMSGGSSEFTGTQPVEVRLWDVASGRTKRALPSPHRVVSVAFAPDGKTVAVSDRDKEINIWQVP